MRENDYQNDTQSNLKQTLNQNDDNSKHEEKKPKKHKMKKIFRVLLWILLLVPAIIVILSSSIVVFEAMGNSNSIPGNFQYKPCVERYGLMEPVMQKGDLIIVEKTDPSELEVGDVIVYRLDGNDTVGRIKSMNSSGVNVVADNDAENYGVFVPNDYIQGKWYGFRIPIVGWIVLFIQNSWWVLIVIPCFIEMFIIFGSLIRRSISRKRQANNEG